MSGDLKVNTLFQGTGNAGESGNGQLCKVVKLDGSVDIGMWAFMS